MPSRIAGRVSIASALLAVAACSSSGITVMRSEGGANYSAAVDVQTIAANGTNAVVVRNSPFPPQVIVDALNGRYTSGQYRFALAPAEHDWNGYTVVIGFGGPPVGTHTQCDDPNAALSPASAGETVITGDYCYGNRTVSEAVGRSPALTEASDPRLGDLVGGVVAELFTNVSHRPSGGGAAAPPTPH